MARIVPSQVVSYIDEALPKDNWKVLGPAQVGAVAGLLKLIEQVPGELLVVDSQQFSKFALAISNLTEQLEIWKHIGLKGTTPPELHRGQLEVIRETLSRCPDSSPAPGSSDLSFINYPDLRLSVRIDIAAVNIAFSNGEWKAATVLAGSVIEALLLWALQERDPAEVHAAVAKLGPSKLSWKTAKDLDLWDLADYIEVAFELKIVEENTQKQIRLAREFRNLIHPGRSQRLAQKCDRSTALSAMAGMELVIRDLTPI